MTVLTDEKIFLGTNVSFTYPIKVPPRGITSQVICKEVIYLESWVNNKAVLAIT